MRDAERVVDAVVDGTPGVWLGVIGTEPRRSRIDDPTGGHFRCSFCQYRTPVWNRLLRHTIRIHGRQR